MPAEKHQRDLDTNKAEALRRAASDGFVALQMAHLRYERALDNIADTGVPTGESVVAVRQRGREYAEAVTRYSHAAMAWLAFVETIKLG